MCLYVWLGPVVQHCPLMTTRELHSLRMPFQTIRGFGLVYSTALIKSLNTSFKNIVQVPLGFIIFVSLQ